MKVEGARRTGSTLLLIAFGLLVGSAPLHADELVRFLAAAKDQIGKTLTYDPHYSVLSYPGGDVPIESGVQIAAIAKMVTRLSGRDQR